MSMFILLVEDNPGDVALMKAALGKARMASQLVVAGTGGEAWDVLRRRNGHEQAPHIDLALFDINLPGMTGIELLQKVKSDAELKTLPVIMLTSSEAPDDIENSYREHANCYITKPTDVGELMEIVRTIEDFWFSVARLPKRD